MKNNKGFSLVELIVVIAIMAILAAVAVAGFSLYIPKAQQATDKQMIADIEDQLIYAGYAGTFEEGESGFVVLSKDGVVKIQGEGMIEVLTNAYGEKYNEVLKLAYEQWGNNGLLTGMTAESAYVVASSNFLSGSRADDLLADVEKMTKVANRLTSVITEGSGITSSVTGMFTDPTTGVCAIDTTAAKYGISRDGYATWEEWAEATGNQATYSNLLVLTAADESASGAEMSEASKLVLEFSSYYAFAAKDEDFAAEFETLMSELDNVGSLGQGSAWFDDLRDKADEYGYSTSYKVLEDEENADGEEVYTGDYVKDQLAFQTILSNVSNAANAQTDAIKDNLGEGAFFTQGVVNDLYNEYLSNVDAMQGFYDVDNPVNLDLQAGEVAILFIQKDGQTIITNSLTK